MPCPPSGFRTPVELPRNPRIRESNRRAGVHFFVQLEATTPSSVLLDAQKISVSVGRVRRLTEVSFQVRRHEIACIVGENGSGKSVLLRALAGRCELEDGQLEVARDATRLLLSNDELQAFAASTVEESLVQLVGAVDRVHVLEVIEAFALEPNQPVARTSSGERQRVLLAAAAVATAEITLFDAPAAELDSEGFDRAEALIRSLAARGGTVIVATTNAELIVRLDCSSLFRMRDGSLEPVRRHERLE